MRIYAAVVIALGILPAAFVACGGDDQTPAERDEAYVVALCNATKTFQAESEKLFPAADGEPTAEDLAKAAPLVRDYAKALDRAKPPKDVEEYHDQRVAELEKTAGLLEKYTGGDPFIGMESLPPLPSSIASRLNAIVGENPACEGVDLDFSE